MTGGGLSMGRERMLLLAVAAAAFLVVTGAGISGAGWLLIQNVRALLWGAVLVAAAYLQGSVFIRLATPSQSESGDGITPVLATGLGLGVLSLEGLALGLAGWFNRPALTVLVLFVAAASWAAARRLKIPLRGVPLPTATGALMPLGLTGLAIFFSLMFSLVPPVYFDAMSYHLELPSRYLLEGRIFHVSENLYSGYPQIVEVLYGIGLALSGAQTAGVISLIGFLLVLGLVWSWGRKNFGEETASWATVLVSFTPPIMTLTGFFHNDWYLTFFTLSAVFVLAEGADRPRSMVLAGVLAGLASGTKYTGLGFAVGIPLLAGAICGLGGRGRGAGKRWAVFAGVALVTACPWYLKNLFFTGDPLFPLISGMKGEIQGLSTLAADAYFKGVRVSDLWRWILLPYQSVFRFWELQLPLSPGFIPLVLLPTLPVLRRHRAVTPFLLIWTGVSLLVWYFTFRAGRFALPMAVLTLVWFAAAFRESVRAAPRTGPVLTVVVTFLVFLNLANYLGFQANYADVLNGAFGKIPREVYLERTYAPYRAIDYLNHLDPPPKKVLFLGEMKGFYSRFPREVATFDVPNRLIRLVQEGQGPDSAADSLTALGFSHVLLNRAEFTRLAAKSSLLRLSPEKKNVLENFLRKRTRTVFPGDPIAVLEIIR